MRGEMSTDFWEAWAIRQAYEAWQIQGHTHPFPTERLEVRADDSLGRFEVSCWDDVRLDSITFIVEISGIARPALRRGATSS